MTQPPVSHLLLIPSYNTGAKLVETVRHARRYWQPVWVVIDGSTDGSTQSLQAAVAQDTHIRVIVLPHNEGKGAAVLHGLREAAAAGYSHVLTMDADGQHPAALIPDFMATSRANPDAVIFGQPIFDGSAPAVRVYGRKLSNGLANLQTLWHGIGDSLFGFRVYPIAPLRDIMERRGGMRHFDFEPEAAVRLCWRGLRPIRLPAPVRYFTAGEGGVSHFNYLRDNARLIWMNLRLLAEFVFRLPMLLVGKAGSRALKSSLH
jgi:glycosyltransferase involved in cell wall biosynthesis